MEKKYEFTGETLEYEGRTLHRIRALKDFGNVKAGDVGGWVETEANLSHDGNTRVSGAEDYITCGPIGSRGDITTIFRDSVKKVCVNCGCFSGTLDDFEKAVNKTHPYDQHGMEYRALIALARIRFAYVFDEVT